MDIECQDKSAKSAKYIKARKMAFDTCNGYASVVRNRCNCDVLRSLKTDMRKVQTTKITTTNARIKPEKNSFVAKNPFFKKMQDNSNKGVVIIANKDGYFSRFRVG